MSKIIKVKCKLMWAFLERKNELSDAYQVDLCNLSNDAVNKLEEEGLTVRKRDDQPEKGFFITAKSKNFPINVIDEDGKFIDGNVVGNGTEAVAAVTSYEWKFKNKTGKSPSIAKNGLVITKLVRYDGADTSEPTEEEEVL